MTRRKAGHRLRSDYKPDLGQRLPNIDFRAMDFLWPQSTGCGLDPAMRLIALLLLLWDQETYAGRIEWDHDQIADRTGLPVSHVAAALDRLRQVHLIEETAAGPKLTFEKWDKTTKPQWRNEALMRPTRQSGSPKHTPTEDPSGNDQVEEGRGQAGARGEGPGRDGGARDGAAGEGTGGGAGG